MADSQEVLRSGLKELGLEEDETEVYLTLLREPSTVLRLSRDTALSRTRIYRVIESLENRGLASRYTDDRGTFWDAADPSGLGAALIRQESLLRRHQDIYRRLLPILLALRGTTDSLFVVRTYEGAEGLRQMCWHELKTKGELLSFGAGTIEDIAPNKRWAERHRELSVQAGYRVREIINSETDLPTFTKNDDFMQSYSCRGLSATVVPLDNQFIIYNDTVALYHWRQKKKVGVEVISRTYADMMRHIFEQYWRLADPRRSFD